MNVRILKSVMGEDGESKLSCLRLAEGAVITILPRRGDIVCLDQLYEVEQVIHVMVDHGEGAVPECVDVILGEFPAKRLHFPVELVRAVTNRIWAGQFQAHRECAYGCGACAESPAHDASCEFVHEWSTLMAPLRDLVGDTRLPFARVP